MSVILYDLFLVVFGIILGVIASDPLKKLFTGKYKEEARQKKRVKLLVYIRENKSSHDPTTEELAQNVFSGKMEINSVHKLLKEIEGFGLIKGVASKGQDVRKVTWMYIKKQ